MRTQNSEPVRTTVYASIDLVKLAEIIRKRHGKFVSPWELSRIIPVSTRTAGKLLARMEELGFVKRYNKRGVYEMTPYGENRVF